MKEERAMEWIKSGFWSYQKNDFKDAISCYKKALEVKPDFALAWYWYGNALFRYGMGDLAKAAWERYLTLSGNPYIKHKLERYWGKEKEEYTHIFTIKGDIADNSRFFTPCGIWVDRFDNLYVAGYGNDVVLKFSPFGRLLLKISHKALEKPFGVCVDKEGNIYTTSYSNNCVLKFSPQGKLILRFGKKGRKDGEFIGPKGLSVDSSGYIYVVDAQRLQRFSEKGKFISKIDCLLSPNNLALDKEGNIFIADREGIKKFDPSFNYLSLLPIKEPRWIFLHDNKLYATTKDGVYSFENKPIKKIDFKGEALCLNQFGFVYVSSPNSSNIEVFSSNKIDLLVNRIDLAHYPMILFSLTLKKDKYDVPGLFEDNFRVLEENRVVYPLGVDEILKNRENLGLVFVCEDSKYIKKPISRLLLSCVHQFKDGFQGAGVISYSNTQKRCLDFTLNKTEIKDAIEKLSFKDSLLNENAFLSSLNKGIDSAVSFLSKKAIVVITSIRLKKETDEIKRLINYAKNNNIPIFIIDCKLDKDFLLERIAQETNGKYLLYRNSRELADLYGFLNQSLINQTQYILYYHSPNASLKWSNEWIAATIEVGKGRFGLQDEISYLIPPFGGANSSLGRALIEKKLYLKKAARIEEYTKKRERERKRIKEIYAAEKAKHEEKKEEKKEEKEKVEEEKGH